MRRLVVQPDEGWAFLYALTNKTQDMNPIAGSRVSSAKKNSVCAEMLRQGGCLPSQSSETPRWRMTPHPVSIPRIVLHIALQSPFHQFFRLCRCPILNQHSGVGANCDNTSEWVHWVHTCIWIAMRRVTSQKSLLTFLLPVHKMQFSLY